MVMYLFAAFMLLVGCLIIIIRQRDKMLDDLSEKLHQASTERDAGAKIATDLMSECTGLKQERDLYLDAYKGSEKKRQELVDRLHSLQEGGAEDDVQT